MKNSTDVINSDLKYICKELEEELISLSGKRVLITGGAGFLGYYLVKSIIFWNKHNSEMKPITLVVYDNFMRGTPDWLKEIQDDKSLDIVKYDVIDQLPKNIGDFQYIIHAASIASPIYYRLNPIQTMDANVSGLRHLLDYCHNQKEKGKGVEGFLFYSTSEIYGDPDPNFIPTDETYRGNVSCTGPRACYDESKRYGETLCVNFAQQYDLPIRIVRPFNNYGPGLKITDGRALPDFARNVINNKDIVLLSDGSPSRTFCYVADAVVGYFKVMIKGKDGEAYNIGIDKPEITIRQLAENVILIANQLFDYKGTLVLEKSNDAEYLTDNPNRRCPIIDKAKNDLGYDPKIQLDDGLKRSLLWYADNNDVEEEN